VGIEQVVAVRALAAQLGIEVESARGQTTIAQDLVERHDEILEAGGFSTGGFNFDAKLRRQSISRSDLFHAHITGIDTLARSLLVAADMVEARTLSGFRESRYADWSGGLGRSILEGKASLADLHDQVATGRIDPQPRSGGQERLEGQVNRRIWAADRP